MLVLVRHGRTEWNRERRLAGRTDVGLDDTGRAQAVAAGRALGRVVELRSSSLSRARETAGLLGTGLDVVVDDAFIELDYGQAEGMRLDDIDAERWRLARDAPETGWPGGESMAELQARVAVACEALFAREGAGARREDGDVVVVSHVGPIKAAACWVLGLGPEAQLRLRLDNATLTTIGTGPFGPHLLSYNVRPPQEG